MSKVTAAKELDIFAENNPSGNLYSRKKCIDFTRYQREYGARHENAAKDSDKPFTEHGFKSWCLGNGLSEQGAQNWWNELKQQRHLATDYKGRHEDGRPGCFRIWVPEADESKDHIATQYFDNKVAQGGKDVKDAKDADVQHLLNFTLASADSKARKFINEHPDEARHLEARDCCVLRFRTCSRACARARGQNTGI